MDKRNLTYRQLERMTGISHTTLNKIAIGDTSPTQNTMISIAKGLRMDVTEIFDLKY
ncbi:helix-turn-helix transcriptional regulator [uncultured Clostridium sp.]|nr:helix-turn-helix transcriptional regulator [Clostridium transplantifaecale]